MSSSPDTILAAGHHVEGRLHGSGLVQVLGSIRGSVELDGTLLVDIGGRVEGELVADHVLVAGTVDGTLRARSLVEVAETGVVLGACHTPRLVVADGGRVEGQVVMAAPEQEPGATTRATAGATAAVGAPKAGARWPSWMEHALRTVSAPDAGAGDEGEAEAEAETEAEVEAETVAETETEAEAETETEAEAEAEAEAEIEAETVAETVADPDPDPDIGISPDSAEVTHPDLPAILRDPPDDLP